MNSYLILAHRQEIAIQKMNRNKYPVNKISLWCTSYTELLAVKGYYFPVSMFGNHTFLGWLLGSVWNTTFLKQDNPPFQQQTKMTEASIFIDSEGFWDFITTARPLCVVHCSGVQVLCLSSLVKMRMLWVLPADFSNKHQCFVGCPIAQYCPFPGSSKN